MSDTTQSLLRTSLHFYRQVRLSVFCRENNWQPETGEYRGDCSGLLLTLLKQYDCRRYQQLCAHACSLRPKAFQIYDWLSQPQSGIRLNQKLNAVQPGDIIIWRKLNPPKSGDTGHLALVLELGELDTNHQQQQQQQQQQQLSIKVMDVSRQAHDRDDRDRPGIACGWMRLTADSDGFINGYRWSTELKKAKRTQVLVAHID